MREMFEDIHSPEPVDPIEAARRNMAARRRRFYGDAEVNEEATGATLCARWPSDPDAGQQLAQRPEPGARRGHRRRVGPAGRFIDPAAMPLTRLANTIIDGVTLVPDEVAGEVAKYLRSDLVCYRAATPQGFVARQAAHWDPIVAWARDVLGARFVVRGASFPWPVRSGDPAARAEIPRDPRLGAVHSISTLTGSALIAFAVAPSTSPPMTRGRPPMSTRTGTSSSGAATNSRSSAAITGKAK